VYDIELASEPLMRARRTAGSR